MNPNINPRAFLNKLEQAYQCCHFCGTLYGEPRAGASTMWHGTCDVCGEPAAVTETRDYGYLHKSIQSIKTKHKIK